MSLVAAVRARNTRKAAGLLRDGSDANAVTLEDKSPLHYACQGNDAPMVRLLLQQGGARPTAADNVGRTALHEAACFNADRAAAELLAHAPHLVHAVDDNGLTALHVAALNNAWLAATVLVDAGADVRAQTSAQSSSPLLPAGGSGPLHFAAETNSLEVARVLLAAGAPLDAPASDGSTPLHRCAEYGARDVAALLLAAGANPTPANKRGQLPVDVACSNAIKATLQRRHAHAPGGAVGDGGGGLQRERAGAIQPRRPVRDSARGGRQGRTQAAAAAPPPPTAAARDREEAQLQEAIARSLRDEQRRCRAPPQQAWGPSERTLGPSERTLGPSERTLGPPERIQRRRRQSPPARAAAAAAPAAAALPVRNHQRRAGGAAPSPAPAAPAVNCMAYSRLAAATNNFSSMLGQGGFGTVFHGLLAGNTDVAVKRLDKDAVASSSATSRAQFEAEIGILATFQHPNIVQLLGVSVDGPYLCLVYAFMEGGSLGARLDAARQPPLSWLHRLAIAEDVAKGLAYLHAQRHIHRDLSAGNILLDRLGGARIGDFGLARVLDSGASAQYTQRVAGTIGYLSPEYQRGVVTAKLDVFALGVLMLQLLTGQPVAFDGRRTLAARVQDAAARNGPGAPGRDLAAQLLDPRLGTAVDGLAGGGSALALLTLAMRATQDDADRRPTASRLQARLAGIQADAAAVPVAPAASTAPSRARPMREAVRPAHVGRTSSARGGERPSVSASASSNANAPACVVCLEGRGELMVAVPCGHLVCRSCSRRLGRPAPCPVCRASIERMVRVFL